MWIEDCAVTPKAQNEDLWIVRQLRPYDSASVTYSEAEMEEAVAQALARHGINVGPLEASAPSPFGIQISNNSTEASYTENAAEFSVGPKSAWQAQMLVLFLNCLCF